MDDRDVLARELAYHEKLYSGFAQRHFARPGVRAFRRHLVKRIIQRTGAGPDSRVLSLGCGIGDTELVLAPHVARILGIDLSPSAIRQAEADAAAAGCLNVEFLVGDLGSLEARPESFDVIIAVFFLHHLDDDSLAALPGQIRRLLHPGGVFYGLDPSRFRLSGAVGRLIIPHLMAEHQSPDERELVPAEACSLFDHAGLQAETSIYDFLSTPVAGLFPANATLYRLSRAADELLVRIPLLRRAGSNFELLARPSGRTRDPA